MNKKKLGFAGIGSAIAVFGLVSVFTLRNVSSSLFNATPDPVNETISFSRATSEDFHYIGSGFRYSSKKTTSSGTVMYAYGSYVDKLGDSDTTTLFYLNYASAVISISSTQNSLNEFEFQSISKLKLTSGTGDSGLHCTVSYSIDGTSFEEENIDQAFVNNKTLEFEGAKLVRIKHYGIGCHIRQIDITYCCLR